MNVLPWTSRGIRTSGVEVGWGGNYRVVGMMIDPHRVPTRERLDGPPPGE
jgi:hypothetical protein